MTLDFRYSPGMIFRKGSTVILSLVWVFGLLAGYGLYLSTEEYMVSLMHGVLRDSVSIVWVLLPTLLPFLCSAYAVYISQPWLVLFWGFLKAFLFSYVSLGAIFCFGSAGWLFRLLLMFSEIFTVPLLYWYMHRHLSQDSRFSLPESFAVLSVYILIGSIDYAYILPYLAGMLKS